jgi:alkylhydroperoxidase family enzyme
MARIAYPSREQLPSELLQMLSEMPRHAPVDMLAHSPRVGAAFLRLAQAQFTSVELSHRNRELLILTVAAHERCEYEYVQHVPISQAAGVEPALREAIWRREVDASSLAAEDRALVNFVTAVLDSPDVEERMVTEARRWFSERELVEILQLIGFYWGLGRLCSVLDVEIDTPDGLTSIDAVSKLSRQS